MRIQNNEKQETPIHSLQKDAQLSKFFTLPLPLHVTLLSLHSHDLFILYNWRFVTFDPPHKFSFLMLKTLK